MAYVIVATALIVITGISTSWRFALSIPLLASQHFRREATSM